MPDAVSDVAGARTGVGSVAAKTPEQVRAAQLALASVALQDPEREADLREVLSAAGLFTRNGRVASARARRSIGTIRRYGRLPGDAREPREPSGRPSRAAKRLRDRVEKIERGET